MTSEPQTAEQLPDHYDAFADAYARANENGLLTRWYARPAALDMLGDVAGRRRDQGGMAASVRGQRGMMGARPDRLPGRWRWLMSTAAPSSAHLRRNAHDQRLASRRWGWASIVSALVALTGLGWTWSYSVTDFDPLPWLRIPLILLLPLGLIATTACAAIAWAGAGRPLARIALSLWVLVVVAFVVLLTMMG